MLEPETPPRSPGLQYTNEENKTQKDNVSKFTQAVVIYPLLQFIELLLHFLPLGEAFNLNHVSLQPCKVGTIISDLQKGYESLEKSGDLPSNPQLSTKPGFPTYSWLLLSKVRPCFGVLLECWMFHT